MKVRGHEGTPPARPGLADEPRPAADGRRRHVRLRLHGDQRPGPPTRCCVRDEGSCPMSSFHGGVWRPWRSGDPRVCGLRFVSADEQVVVMLSAPVRHRKVLGGVIKRVPHSRVNDSAKPAGQTPRAAQVAVKALACELPAKRGVPPSRLPARTSPPRRPAAGSWPRSSPPPSGGGWPRMPPGPGGSSRGRQARSDH